MSPPILKKKVLFLYLIEAMTNFIRVFILLLSILLCKYLAFFFSFHFIHTEFNLNIFDRNFRKYITTIKSREMEGMLQWRYDPRLFLQ